MKLKILFFPLALILCVVVFIWYIKPEFGNIKNNGANLKNKEKELADMIKKEKNISDLIANLDSQPEKEKLVLSYLPPYERQERIIDLLNFLANESLLAVSNININAQKGSLAKAASGNSGGGGEPGAASDINMPPVSDTPASVSVVGSYENIKNYLGRIFTFGQMNNIESVLISKVPAEKAMGESESSSDGETGILKADIGIKFNYATSVASVSGFNSPVFSLSEFDFNVTDDLNKAIEGGKIVPGIIIDAKGRTNPFSSP